MKQRPLGPYQIEKRLATGGMAELYVAKRVGPHGFRKRVALKRILPQYARDQDFVAMFIDEARLSARLDHPNIVQVFDFGEVDGELFLAMELVEGTHVNSLLRAVANREDAVPLDVALHIASQAAHALSYAHEQRDEFGELLGIVHRDVSPANLLLTSGGHVKLTDFGIARAADRDARTDEGHVRGKLGYMSPEQVMARELDGRSDVFTLTTVLAEMVTAEPFFGVGSDLDVLLRIRDVDLTVLDRTEHKVPPDVRALICRGLAREVGDRPDAGSFAEGIDEVIRRRGFGHGPERLSLLLRELGLVQASDPGRVASSRPPRKATTLVELTELKNRAERVVGGEMAASAPAIYQVRSADGVTRGPMSYAALVGFLATGRVGSSAVVSREGGAFLALPDLPELSRFAAEGVYDWTTECPAQQRGDVGPAGLLPVVFEIVRARTTGLLRISDGSRSKKVYFRDGRPEFVASTDRRELLGEYLVDQGICLRMEVEMALTVLARYNGRLGDALVGLGVLRPIELYRGVSAQVRERFLEIFSWRRGTWELVLNLRCDEEAYPLDRDVTELLRDAVQRAHPDQLAEAVGPAREMVLSINPSPPVPAAAFKLPEEWQRLIDGVTGDATLGAVLDRESARGTDPDELYRALYLGMSCGLVAAETN